MNKKFSLKNLNIKEVEQLSREQLKNVLGGFTDGTGDVTSEPGDGSDRACDPDNCSGSCTTSEGKTGNCVKGKVECRCAVVEIG